MLADLDLLLTTEFCPADDLLPKRAKNARRRFSLRATSRVLLVANTGCLAVIARALHRAHGGEEHGAGRGPASGDAMRIGSCRQSPLCLCNETWADRGPLPDQRQRNASGCDERDRSLWALPKARDGGRRDRSARASMSPKRSASSRRQSLRKDSSAANARAGRLRAMERTRCCCGDQTAPRARHRQLLLLVRFESRGAASLVSASVRRRQRPGRCLFVGCSVVAAPLPRVRRAGRSGRRPSPDHL